LQPDVGVSWADEPADEASVSVLVVAAGVTAGVLAGASVVVAVCVTDESLELSVVDDPELVG
jgi:hypothetical protein